MKEKILKFCDKAVEKTGEVFEAGVDFVTENKFYCAVVGGMITYLIGVSHGAKGQSEIDKAKMDAFKEKAAEHEMHSNVDAYNQGYFNGLTYDYTNRNKRI